MNDSNKNEFPKCVGIDNCPEFVEICREKGLTAIHSDMANIPLDSNSADGILSIASFHHLASVERRISALTEMKRLLKPGGKILLSVWSIKQPEKTRRKFENYGDVIVPWNQFGKIYERYYYIFKIDEITDLFHQVGLKITSHEWNCGNEVFILTKDAT
jgi:tRNA (uracil-5-)-methyltransferase TRM9